MSILPSGASSAKLDEIFENANAWLDEATAGATQLRVPLRIEVVRTLTPEDFAGGFTQPAPPPSLREIKASHHSLAKLIAAGRSNIEASRVTGYSPVYISRLRDDGAFKELIHHYEGVEELASTDFLGQMRAVGMDMLDELRKRMEESPNSLTIAQLQEGIKLLLVEPMKAEAAVRSFGGGGGGAPALQISFVASATPQAGEIAEGKIIEGEKGRGE